MRATLAAFAALCCCLATSGLADSPIKHRDVWQWPLEDSGPSAITQGFAEYDAFVPGYHHSGLDIAAEKRTPVVAVAEGYIVNLIPNGKPGCGPGTCVDHGDGNTIIIYHLAFLGKHQRLIYSHYQHLDDFEPNLKKTIEDPEEKVCKHYGSYDGTSGDPNGVSVYGWSCPLVDAVHVNAGDLIGYSGASGFGQEPYYDWHLHFEVKTFGTLYSWSCFRDEKCCPQSDHKKCFGYTKTHPFKTAGCKGESCPYGYLDPVNWVQKMKSKKDLRVMITGDGQGLSMRIGPSCGRVAQGECRSGDSRQYDLQTLVSQYGDFYWALERAIPTDGCAQGWYKVSRPASDGRDPGFPPPVNLYFSPTNATRATPGPVPVTWICIGNDNQTYVVPAP